MKLTFEEYLDSYKNEPDWMTRPTLEDYKKIQEECLLAEFLGYKEYPNTILHRWDEQGEVWYEQMFRHGLYLTYNPVETGRKVFEGDDELIIGEMHWKSWDNLMMIVSKISESNIFKYSNKDSYEEDLINSLKSALYFSDSCEAYDICLEMIKHINSINNELRERDML